MKSIDWLGLVFGIIYLSLHIRLICGQGLSCESGWERYDEKCYKLVHPPNSLISSEIIKLCEPLGSHPLHLKSQDENDWVVGFATRALQTQGKFPEELWVLTGAHKDTSGTWVWKTGKEICGMNYTNWGPGEPVEHSDGKVGLGNAFIYLHPTKAPYGWDTFYGKWNDIEDDIKTERPIICEKAAEGAPADAAYCNYDDCLKIKKTTMLRIMQSCKCSS